MNNDYPNHLKINGRLKLTTRNFDNIHKLYRAYNYDDLDESGEIGLYSIKFPDFSCNWGEFSVPQDIHYRKNGKETDGCYSITVQVARYKNFATPVHDPIIEDTYENYAHVEVRQLYPGENIFFEPPKCRPKKCKSSRMEYRQNIILNLNIEISFE